MLKIEDNRRQKLTSKQEIINNILLNLFTFSIDITVKPGRKGSRHFEAGAIPAGDPC
jgi:hypothetical protein